ncbi:unnamed protein product [Mytilus coruscus]|uniref:Uncharacterized protein n=1 Tax=Mytilus coruscus TaxID=42192 RepID=A0A6J8BFY6_MYTCO|nr:unnamed protein product [Mytilus coruscus]
MEKLEQVQTGQRLAKHQQKLMEFIAKAEELVLKIESNAFLSFSDLTGVSSQMKQWVMVWKHWKNRKKEEEKEAEESKKREKEDTERRKIEEEERHRGEQAETEKQKKKEQEKAEKQRKEQEERDAEEKRRKQEEEKKKRDWKNWPYFMQFCPILFL